MQSSYTPIVHVAMIGWIPFVLILFAYMVPRRAVIVSFVAGWLFLPAAIYPYKGLPEYTKMSAIIIGVMLGIVFFDLARLMRWRPKLIDLMMLTWCLCPLASSLANDLGVYDGLANVLKNVLHWGFPYLVGRLYFSDPRAMRELAIGILIGGIIYVPLALWEIRMSPQLHNILYGFAPAKFVHTLRYGGYRPMVFMHGGLALGLWMASASAVALVLWRSGSLKRLWGWPILAFAVPLWITLVLCKSTGALLLLIVASGLLFSAQILRTRTIFLAAILAIPIYLTSRIVFNWSGDQLGEIAAQLIDEKRGESLITRLENENAIVHRALSQGHAALGWGGYARSRITNDEGEDISIVDSTWIIALGERGLLGMSVLFMCLLTPLLLMAWQVSPRLWFDPLLAPAFGLSLVVWIFAVDRLLNAQLNPVPIMVIGGLATMPWRRIVAAIYARDARMQRRVATTSPGYVHADYQSDTRSSANHSASVTARNYA